MGQCFLHLLAVDDAARSRVGHDTRRVVFGLQHVAARRGFDGLWRGTLDRCRAGALGHDTGLTVGGCGPGRAQFRDHGGGFLRRLALAGPGHGGHALHTGVCLGHTPLSAGLSARHHHAHVFGRAGQHGVHSTVRLVDGDVGLASSPVGTGGDAVFDLCTAPCLVAASRAAQGYGDHFAQRGATGFGARTPAPRTFLAVGAVHGAHHVGHLGLARAHDRPAARVGLVTRLGDCHSGGHRGDPGARAFGAVCV